jgi:hypothetical protein
MRAERKKPGWVFYTTVALSLPLLYVATFGPACWVSSRTGLGTGALGAFYRPLVREISVEWRASMLDDQPNENRIGVALEWYANFGAAEDWRWWPAPGAANDGKGLVWRKVQRAPELIPAF